MKKVEGAPRPALGDQLVVEVFVADLGRSLAVYTALGFKLERRDQHFVVLRFDGREFFLDEHSDLPPSSGLARANIRILTDDIDAMWALVQRLGLRVSQPIANRYYGLRDFTVLDPDGFGLRFAGMIGKDDARNALLGD